MGSSVSDFWDDYDSYEYICKLNYIEVGDADEMYSHLDEILKYLGFKSKSDYFSCLVKQKERDKKLKEILK